MTLSEILSNEELRLREFPVARNKVFLAHAGVCPLPNRVAEAVRNYASQCTQGDQETLVPVFQIHKSRELAARLLNAAPDEIAFVGPTSSALSLIADGLKLSRSDNVVVYLDDYPSNVYPWMALAEKGIEVRFLNIRQWGRIRPIDVIGQVDENTRLVALASCHFVAGYRIELDAIGRALKERNILFCVDGIQTVGAFPTNTENIDFLAADSHKWMLGPCAAGLLFVKKRAMEEIHPAIYGWNNVKSPNFVAQEEIVFRPDARRFEAGSHNLLGLVGLNAAMELLLEIGIENIAQELLRKRGMILSALQAKGYSVLQGDVGPQNASGIVSFYKAGMDMPALHRKLEEANIILSLRSDRAGQHYVRVSPHFYNTDAELHRLFEFL